MDASLHSPSMEKNSSAAARQKEIPLRHDKTGFGIYHDDCNGLYFLFEEKSRITHGQWHIFHDRRADLSKTTFSRHSGQT